MTLSRPMSEMRRWRARLSQEHATQHCFAMFGVELMRQDLGELSATTVTAHLGGAM